jgi:AraC-like DNA-binding protein
MRFLGGRRSVFFTWLLSYSAILCLLALLGLGIHLQASNVLIRQIDRARTATLRQAAGAIDARLEDVERLELHVSWNPRLASFMYQRAPVAPEDRYTLNLLFRDFLISKAAYPFIQSFYVYFHDSDIVLSSETVATSELFYHEYMREAVPSYRDWLSLMRGSHERSFALFPDSIAYVKSLPADRSLPMKATLAILLDRGWLAKTLAAAAWNDQESMVILDPEDRVLARTGGGVVPPALRYGEPAERGYGRRLLVTSAPSAVSGWKVVSILPKDAFLRPVTSLRVVTLLGLSLCLVIGGLVAYRFSKRNYDRISEVTRDMASLAGIAVDRGNEYKVLREAVSATLSWKAKLDSDLRQHNAAMRQNFLRRMVRGRFADAEELDRSFADFGIVPLSPYHAVFIVYPEGLPESAGAPGPGRRLASFIIASAVEAIIGRRHGGYVTEYDDMLVCIVSLRLLSALEWRSDLDAIIADTRTYLAETFGTATTVGLGTLVSGVTSIPQAFQEALDALEYKLVVGSGTVIRYQDVRNRRSVYRCSLETEQQLHNAVRVGDEEKAAEILGLIMERNLRAGEVSIQGLKCFIFDMYNILTQAVSTVDEARQHALGEVIQPLLRVLDAEPSLAHLERDVRGIVREVCRSLGGVRKDNRLAHEIREYVESRYKDLNLSIGTIAERFGLSQGYVSKLFREMTGQSLLDMIAGVRIGHAKEIMERGRASLEDVAGSVGYTSANALIRAFKKHEGITPGRYRHVLPVSEALPPAPLG